MEQAARDDFRRYVVARSPALLRTAYVLTGQRADAEDLLQTTLTKIYASWGRVRDREALDGYVRRTMVNTYLSSWRRRRCIAELPTEVLPERPAPDRALDGVVLHDMLWTAVMALPPRQRATIVLRYYEDLSEADTARTLGVSLGTVKSTTSRALAHLRASAAPGARSAAPAAALRPRVLEGAVG